MSTTLDGTTLVEPSTWKQVHEGTGTMVRMAGGKLAYRTLSTSPARRVWFITWKNVTTAEEAAIFAEWEDALEGEVNFSPPETASTYAVRAVPGSYSADGAYRQGGLFMFTVALTLKEAL